MIKFLRLKIIFVLILLFSQTAYSYSNVIVVPPSPVEKPWGMTVTEIKSWNPEWISFFSENGLDPSKRWGEFWFGDHPQHQNLELKKLASNKKTYDDFAGHDVSSAYYNWYQYHYPVLMKYLLSGRGLSLHYHWDPAERRCNTLENIPRYEPGKVEVWYVLRSDENGGLLMGLKPNVKVESAIKAFIEENNKTGKKDLKTTKKLRNMLKFVKVKAGDVLFMAPWLPHSLGGSPNKMDGDKVAIIEIMHTSDSIVRLSDWERSDPKRPLLRNIKDVAFKESDLKLIKEASNNLDKFIFRADKINKNKVKVKGGFITTLVKGFYGINVIKVEADMKGVLSDALGDIDSYLTILYADGDNFKITSTGKEYTGESVLVDQKAPFVIKSATGGKTSVLVAWMDPKQWDPPAVYEEQNCAP